MILPIKMDYIQLTINLLLLSSLAFLIFIEYPQNKNCVSYCQKEIDYCKSFIINASYIDPNITQNISDALNLSYYNNSSS